MSEVLLINGPNLNLLGRREPEIYGRATLDDIVQQAEEHARGLGLHLQTFQSNHEGEMIQRIHQAMDDGTDYIIINPGALTHTSIALRDALSAISKPFVEVHLSNIFARETFRRHSFLSDQAKAVISGLGAEGYRAALTFIRGQMK